MNFHLLQVFFLTSLYPVNSMLANYIEATVIKFWSIFFFILVMFERKHYWLLTEFCYKLKNCLSFLEALKMARRISSKRRLFKLLFWSKLPFISFILRHHFDDNFQHFFNAFLLDVLLFPNDFLMIFHIDNS